jgi:hypothetical protein
MKTNLTLALAACLVISLLGWTPLAQAAQVCNKTTQPVWGYKEISCSIWCSANVPNISATATAGPGAPLVTASIQCPGKTYPDCGWVAGTCTSGGPSPGRNGWGVCVGGVSGAAGDTLNLQCWA